MWKFILKLLTHTEKLVSHAGGSKASGSSLGLDLACRRLMPEALCKYSWISIAPGVPDQL